MNKIKTNFSIKDLENLSGIKAHTIRIWEKRYNLLQPERTDTNIRFYNLSSLQKILNISYLNKNGYKISKIAHLTNNEVKALVKKIASEESKEQHYINDLKICMMNFDRVHFESIFKTLRENYSFKDIFYLVLVPLLEEIGLLWQTDTITPAHEHFIVELIKLKILIQTDKISSFVNLKANHKTVYVLFLPDNEVHELGLLYSHLELTSLNKHTIYLGQSVPIEGLQYLLKYYNNITFISFFTVKPEKEQLHNYMKEFSDKLLKNTSNTFLISGRLTMHIDTAKYSKSISTYYGTKEVIEAIKKRKL